MQSTLTSLAFCNCCSKAKYNPRTQTCDGINCLHNAFRTEDGDFDYNEAKKCFTEYHADYANLQPKDWKIWGYQEYVKCCFGLDDSGDIINIFTLKYGSVDHRKSVRVCRKIWAHFMGKACTKHRMQAFADAYKLECTPEGSTLTLKSNFNDATMHDTSLREINELYIEAGLDIDDGNMLKMGIVGRTQLETFLWFRDHFDLIGDPQPNLQQVHLDKCEKSEIYEIYCNEIGKINDEKDAYASYTSEVGKSIALTVSSWASFGPKFSPKLQLGDGKMLLENVVIVDISMRAGNKHIRPPK